jgi:4-hydroxybenzoate polyprenyltransferase
MNLLQNYAKFIKLEHTLFSIPLILSGALLAERGWPSPMSLLLIFLAAGGARTFALCLNRIIDRNIDRQNPRTKDRPLANGSMSLLEAWLLAAVSIIIYLAAAKSLSGFCLKYSWIPLVAFTIYPYFKRFTKWSHIGLGLVWSLIPLSGFFAVKPAFDGLGAVLMLALFSLFWLAGFDIIYSTLDEDFDREAGLHSLPCAWGSERALKLSGTFHLISFMVLVVLYGVWLGGPVTVMFLGIIGILLYLEQQFANYVDLSFFKMNVAIGFAVFFFIWSGLKGV